MSEREVLLVDSDSKVRKQMADSFRMAGYQVETTDSAVHVLCSVLAKQLPVVLLGKGSDKKIALADLVPLLKKCNREGNHHPGFRRGISPRVPFNPPGRNLLPRTEADRPG